MHDLGIKCPSCGADLDLKSSESQSTTTKDIDEIIRRLGSSSSPSTRVGLIRELGDSSTNGEQVRRILQSIADGDPNSSVSKEAEIALYRLNMTSSIQQTSSPPPPSDVESVRKSDSSIQQESYQQSISSHSLDVERRLSYVEARLDMINTGESKQIKLPKTNILSDSFLSRAFAIWGHYFVAQLVIGVCIAILYALLISI